LATPSRMTDESRFRRLKLKLTVWYTLVSGLTLALVLAALYLGFSDVARVSSDNELAMGVRDVAAEFARTGSVNMGFVSREHDDDELEHRGRRLGRTGFLFAVLDGQARPLVGNLPDIEGLPDMESFRLALKGQANFSTLQVGEVTLRVYSYPVASRGANAVVQGVRPLGGLEATLSNTLLMAAAVGLLSLPLAAAGGWFLAGRALRPIQEAMLRQRQFVADASHELRTPLTVIRAAAEMVLKRNPGLDPRSKEALSDIIAETDVTTTLVEDLLFLARSDNRTLDLELKQVDLSSLVEDVARGFETVARSKGLEVHVEAHPCSVMGDGRRLRQLIAILLYNAVRYNDTGSFVSVRLSCGADVARLVVEDDGPGIEPQHLGRIFDRFYRADAARTGGGAGLGLSIAKEIVEAHGGHISVSSEPGRGSVFTVVIPRGADRR
jgi:two-component system sensor histidine kinase CiaH